MRLLIVTQVIDIEHPILGFFHRWVEEFAKHCEHIHVICLQKGEFNLPDNVTVYSLGKESGKGRLVYLYRFYKMIWRLRDEYDGVFVHMNQIYILLGGLLWRLWGKKTSLWYVHKHVTLSLRFATLVVNKVFSSASESFLIKSNKVECVGHGIDLSKFMMPAKKINLKNIQICHFGRITSIKNIHTLIKAVSLSKHRSNIVINLYGGTNSEADKIYRQDLEVLVAEAEVKVNLCGPVSNKQIPVKLSETDIAVNLTPTGGWDKVVLEAIASRTLSFTSNTSYKSLYGDYTDQFVFECNNEKDLAKKIDQLLLQDSNLTNMQVESLYTKVQGYDISNLVPKLLLF